MKERIKFLKMERQKIIDEVCEDKDLLVIDYFIKQGHRISAINVLIKELEKETKPKQTMYKSLEDRKKDFIKTIEPFREKYTTEMIDKFVNYWTEPNRSAAPKMKYELQKTWSIGGRLANWKQRNNNFNQPNQKADTKKINDEWN